MLRNALLAIVFLILTSCSLSGNYESSGPCKGFHQDQPSCLRAADNSSVIGKVKIGHTFSEVRQIMGRYPERREASSESETWSYLTDYMAHLMTAIVFKNGLVSEIKQTPDGR
jgi:hypothetical protein